MKNNKKPTSAEASRSLHASMGKALERIDPIIRQELILKQAAEKNRSSQSCKVVESLLSFDLFGQYMMAELATGLRACLRAKSPEEKIGHMRRINRDIFKGYSYLYGYKQCKIGSLWMKKVVSLKAVVQDPEFHADIQDLEMRIVLFGKEHLQGSFPRNQNFDRDFIRLRNNPVFLESTLEKEIKRLFTFMILLQEITQFVIKYLAKYHSSENIETEPTYIYTFKDSDLELSDEKRDTLSSSLEEAIKYQTERLHKFIRQQTVSSRIKPVALFTRLCGTHIRLSSIYLDLASTLLAHLRSEYSLEKQLLLRSLNTVVYEEFHKLYGLKNKSVQSFWKKCVFPIVSDHADPSIYADFIRNEKALARFKMKFDPVASSLSIAIHSKKGIDIIYSRLPDLNPVEEIRKALQFLKIIPDIQDFLAKCLHVMECRSQISDEKKMALIYKEMEKLLQNTAASRQGEDLIKKLERLKNGDFFDRLN